MENQNIIVGLDIGTTKIAAIVGRRDEHNKVEILGIGKAFSSGVSRGVVTHIPQTVDSIRVAIDEASRNAGVDIREVHVGIAGEHIRSIQQNGQLVPKEEGDDEITQNDVDRLTDDMYKLVMLPGEEIIDVIPQEFKVDSAVGLKNPVGMSGRRLEANFHIIIGKVAAVNNIRKCVEKAGLKIASFVLEPIASADAVLNQDEKEAGVALVDIGGGTTDIAVFQDFIIRHTAVIPLGGNIITEDIKSAFSTIRKYAEKLKIEHGAALPDEIMSNEVIVVPGIQGRAGKEIPTKTLAQIIQARMEDIIELVHAEIKNAGLEKLLTGGIVITGGGAQLRDCNKLFEEVTGLETRVGYPTEHLSKAPAENIALPMYSTGIGLILRGIQFAEKTMRRGTQEQQAPKKRSGFLSTLFDDFFSEGVK